MTIKPEKQRPAPKPSIEDWPLSNAQRERLKTVRRLAERSCGPRHHAKGQPLPRRASPLTPRRQRKLDRLKREENRILAALTRPAPDSRDVLAQELSASIPFLIHRKDQDTDLAGLDEISREFWRRADRLNIAELPPFPSSQSKTVADIEGCRRELLRAVEALPSLEQPRNAKQISGGPAAEQAKGGAAVNEKATEKPPSKRKEPSRQAVAAWRAWKFGGEKQAEIGKRLGGLKQYKISRMCKEVEQYRNDGNALPDLGLPSETAKPASVDPSAIEMGERQDGLTRRQRRKADEADE
jgi:hypothetical protein